MSLFVTQVNKLFLLKKRASLAEGYRGAFISNILQASDVHAWMQDDASVEISEWLKKCLASNKIVGTPKDWKVSSIQLILKVSSKRPIYHIG